MAEYNKTPQNVKNYFKQIDSSSAINLLNINSNIESISYNYLPKNSIFISLEYSHYFKIIFITSDTLDLSKKDSIWRQYKGNYYVHDSNFVYEIDNIRFEFDKLTGKLMEFNRNRSITDTIDFTTFSLDRFFDNGSSLNVCNSIEWHKNGKLKSNVWHESNYMYVTKYHIDGVVSSPV